MDTLELIPHETKKKVMTEALAEVALIGNRAREIKIVNSKLQLNPEVRKNFGETVRNVRRILKFYDCI